MWGCSCAWGWRAPSTWCAHTWGRSRHAALWATHRLVVTRALAATGGCDRLCTHFRASESSAVSAASPPPQIVLATDNDDYEADAQALLSMLAVQARAARKGGRGARGRTGR